MNPEVEALHESAKALGSIYTSRATQAFMIWFSEHFGELQGYALQLTGGDIAILIKNILIDGLDSTRSASEYMKKVDVEEYERSEKDCMWERD